MFWSMLDQHPTEKLHPSSKNVSVRWVHGWKSTAKRSTAVFHGNIKMIRSTPMFGSSVLHFEMSYFCFSHFRYTQSKDGEFVYASVLVWPDNSTEITLGTPVSSASTRVTLLGSNMGPLKWRPVNTTGGMIIDVSNVKIYSLASDWAWVFKFENVGSVPSRKYRLWPPEIVTMDWNSWSELWCDISRAFSHSFSHLIV